MAKRYIQVIFDLYQPNVEGQLIRDMIAMKNSAVRDEFVVVCHSYEPEASLRALGIDRIPEFAGEVELTIVYKTTEFWPEHPSEQTNQVVMRDLYAKKLGGQVDTQSNCGYYLPEQGWGIRETINLNKMGPRGLADPMVKVLWGSKDEATKK